MAVDLSAPGFMKKNMQRGLDNLNKAGSGLTAKTIRDARNIISSGKVSEQKVRKMYAWHRRHLTDLDRSPSNPNDKDTWRASDVAFLLWGSNPFTNPMQAGDWANRKVAQLDNEEKRAVDNLEQDLYVKEKDAIAKAKELGCDGAHIHEIDGETYYMPCKNMEDYTKLTGKKHTDENDTTLISYNDKRAPSEPAPKKDQIEGSKKNPKGSATGKSNNIKFNEGTLKAIKTIVDNHNEDTKDMASWRKLRMPVAKAVVRRGFGAYSTSHRPGVSRQAWGLARLKAFSYLLKNNRPKNSKYITDNDLLPEKHPRFSGKEQKSNIFYDTVIDAITLTTKILNKRSRISSYMKEKENRSFSLANVEIREETDKEDLSYTFSGYASVFDKPYGVRDSKGAYEETIKPGAFKKTLKEQDDVRFLINHDGIPLARSSSGTLKLEEDDYGLFVQADLDPNNPKVAEVASAMKRGDLNEMSFAFAPIRDDFDGDKREVQEVRLFDVSVVTYPANSWAGATLRGVDISDMQKELVQARSGEKAVEVLEELITKLENDDRDDNSKNNTDLEILKVKMKRDGLLKDVTPGN